MAPSHRTERDIEVVKTDAVSADARHVIGLERNALLLQGASLGRDVVDVELGDGVTGLAGVLALVHTERRPAPVR